MALEIRRLHLASLRGVDGRDWPVHGFAVMHPRGVVLVDTGVGGPERWLTDWRVVNRTAAEALGDHGLAPGDVAFVVNTHLHFDHCGQNAVFRHAPFYVQRAELERARREARPLLTGSTSPARASSCWTATRRSCPASASWRRQDTRWATRAWSSTATVRS